MELNQVQETNVSLDENLFADDEQETTEENVFEDDDLDENDDFDEGESEQEEVVEKPTEKVEDKKAFLKVKYNKEDKELSQEEAINFAQKGMNYDKVNERLTTLTTKLEKLAKANNLDVDAYLKNLDDMQVGLAIEKEMDALKEAHPDTDEALLKEIAQSRVNAKAQESISSQKNVFAQQVNEFIKRFPNVDARELDDEVYKLMDEGKSLTEAYLLVEHNKQVEQSKVKEKVDSQNQANKKKSLGNISNVANDDEDDFMNGLSKYF